MPYHDLTGNASWSSGQIQYKATECVIGQIIISLIGLPANILVVILILKAKGKKSTTTQLLLNLAIADLTNLLLVDACVVLLFSSHIKRKKTLMVITHAAKIAANFTLALISSQRYEALVKAMKLVRITKVGRKDSLQTCG